MSGRSAGFHASPYLLLSLTAFFWSLNWVIGRAIAGHVTPFALAFIRWVVAVAVMMPFAWRDIRAFWGTGLHNVFAYAGLQYTTATNGVILTSSVPMMIIVLAWLVYRETITGVQSLGVLVSLAGVLAILTRGDPAVLAQLSLNKGDVIILVGMVFWAAYTVFLRHKPTDLSGLSLLAACGAIGIVLMLPFFLAEMLFMGGRIELTPATAGAMLYVGIFPTFVGYVFWNRGVAEVGSSVAGIFMHLMPVFGSLLAWMFLGEHIRPFHIAGIALILAGIAFTSRGRRAVPEPGPE
jgi:drug/metabolite transporter (DMT)-like permease